jgi:tetratricopeptide (TPR) repeat protein
MTQAGVIVHYLRLAIVPWPLVLDYGWPRAASLADVALPAAIVVGLLGLTVWPTARRMPIGFAGLWFFVTLAPTSSVVPIVTEVAAEHRMYLPLAAIVASVVCGVHRLATAGGPERAAPRAIETAASPDRLTLVGPDFQTRRGRSAGSAALRAITIGVVILFAFMTDARNRDYHSFDDIWLDTIARRPANARGRVNYASALVEQHRYHDAERHLRVAIDVEPDYPEAQANLGVALCAQGQLDEGIAHLQRAIAIQPDYAAAHQNLGEAWASQGRLAEAAAAFGRALAYRPNDVMLLNRRGWILATATEDAARNGRDAIALAERAVGLTNRRDVTSLDTLAAAYAEADRFADAEVTGREALTLARSTGDQTMVPELEQRLEAYQDHRKIRQ